MLSYHFATSQPNARLSGKWCEKSPDHPLCICEKEPTHPNCCCTPVILSDFIAVEEGPSIILYWTIEQEKDNDYFSLYGSHDANHWVKISDIKGRGTTQEKKVYKYVDNRSTIGRSYYLLQQTDYDGTFKYLGVVTADNKVLSIERYSITGKPANASDKGLIISKISTTKGIYITKIHQD